MDRKSEDVSKELLLWNENKAKAVDEITRHSREKLLLEQKLESANKRLETCEENIKLIKTVLRDILLQECVECQPTIISAPLVEQKPQSSSPYPITAQNPDGQLVRITAPWSENLA